MYQRGLNQVGIGCGGSFCSPTLDNLFPDCLRFGNSPELKWRGLDFLF
jgi:hypothetical protein